MSTININRVALVIFYPLMMTGCAWGARVARGAWGTCMIYPVAALALTLWVCWATDKYCFGK